MRIGNQILTTVSLVGAPALVLEVVVPASGRLIAVGAAAFALATWFVPVIGLAASAYRMRAGAVPKLSSLGVVGVGIFWFMFLPACTSLTGLSLALLSLVFARSTDWAWLALLGLTAFWVSAGTFLVLSDRNRRAKRQPGTNPPAKA